MCSKWESACLKVFAKIMAPFLLVLYYKHRQLDVATDIYLTESVFMENDLL